MEKEKIKRMRITNNEANKIYKKTLLSIRKALE
jgi:acetylglutamate kinase